MSLFGAALYDWLLLLHILAAMTWVGGLVALNVLASHVLRAREPDAVARFVGSLPVIGPVLLAPATVAVLGFGIWLTIDGDAWGFGQTWVWLGLALFAGAVVVGAALGGRAGIYARRAVAAGHEAEAARQLRNWTWATRLMVLLLVLATSDMVLKPGL
jgi:uncharacterized membrane protein